MNTKFKQTEIGKIPKEWGAVKVEDIFEVYGGTTPSTSNKEYWNGDILWVTPTDVTNLNENLNLSETEKKITEKAVKESSLKVLQPGTLLLTSRATIGFTAINSRPVTVNQGMAALIKRNENTNNTFYAYYFSLLKDYLKQLGAGSTFKEVSKSTIKKIKIPLPPLPEQQKIAEILSTVDEAIQRVEEAIAKTERLKRGLMRKLLTKGIGHKEFKFSRKLGCEIPKEWRVVRLKDYAIIKGRIGWRGLKASEYVKEGPYLIANKHITNGRVLWKNCDHLSNYRYEESPEIQLKINDVIMSKDGTIGQVALIDYLPDRATLNSTMMLIRTKSGDMRSKFLYYFFQGSFFKRFLYQKISGGQIPHIFQRDMKNLLLLLPPLTEQGKIAAILSTVGRKLELERKRKEKLERIKRGLMNDLLTGRKRAGVVRNE